MLTRSEGLSRLNSFLEDGLSDYDKLRNYDDPSNVSQLSAFLSRRLISEQEIISACLKKYNFNKIQKFIQEVVWRTYWKGYLEQRPQIWSSYKTDLASLGQSSPEYKSAIAANTGIRCFDHWAEQLNLSGYLHNHARMWFASIWIFTLKLPWQLGADYFYNNLVDADPASNTLSWRWVAGIQTNGKHYVARAENIKKFTNGRFNPVGELNEEPLPLKEDLDLTPKDYDPGEELPKEELPLLVSEDDLTPELTELSRLAVSRVDILAGGLSDSTLNETKQRLEAAYQKEVKVLKEPAKEKYVMLKPHVGREVEVSAANIRRNWDRILHPYAKKGYFNFKKSTEALVKKLCES